MSRSASQEWHLMAPMTAMDMAQAFWTLLIPFGLQNGALSHVPGRDGDDVQMIEDETGWQDEYTQWWFDFLNEKGGKGVSKDTWQMVSALQRAPCRSE